MQQRVVGAIFELGSCLGDFKAAERGGTVDLERMEKGTGADGLTSVLESKVVNGVGKTDLGNLPQSSLGASPNLGQTWIKLLVATRIPHKVGHFLSDSQIRAPQPRLLENPSCLVGL